jgi:hypothetical protein
MISAKFKNYCKKPQSKSLAKELKIECSKVLTKDTDKRVKIKEKFNECKIEEIIIF